MNKPAAHLKTFLIIFGFFTFSGLWVCAAEESPDTEDDAHAFTHDQIKRGERLFYGLIPIGEEAASCNSCHNTRELDSLNWYPSAFDIALTSIEKSLDEFTADLLNPMGEMKSQVHKNYDISIDDISLIKAYLAEFKEEGLTMQKPAIIKRFLFVFAILLIFAAITDLAITRKIRFRIVHGLLILASLFYIVDVTVKEAIAVGRSPEYAPDQPVKFSHMIHAGQNQIDCLYCHNTAEHSKTAGIPSANVCLNCHELVVKEGSLSGSFEINRIRRAVNNNQPIVWNKVYNLPDHVFFSHAQHVGVGDIECVECHGDVDKMDIVKAYNDLSMGWCVNCHRDTEVQFIDNGFYEKYEQLHKELKSGDRTLISVEDIGGTECMKCHY
jgi:hypothetical protein